MTNAVEMLQAEVLSLSKADRARLLNRLVASLDEDTEMELAWDEVADARAAAMASGFEQGVALEDVIAVLEAKFPG